MSPQCVATQCGKLPKGYRIQNITQTLYFFEAAEENYWDDDAVESFSFRYIRALKECPAIHWYSNSNKYIPHKHMWRVRDAPFDFWGGEARLFLKKNVCFQISVKKNICWKLVHKKIICWKYQSISIKVEFKINDLQGIIGAQIFLGKFSRSLQVII